MEINRQFVYGGGGARFPLIECGFSRKDGRGRVAHGLTRIFTDCWMSGDRGVVLWFSGIALLGYSVIRWGARFPLIVSGFSRMEEWLIGGCEAGFQPCRGGMLVARGGNPGDGALPHVWVSGLGRKIFLPTDLHGLKNVGCEAGYSFPHLLDFQCRDVSSTRLGFRGLNRRVASGGTDMPPLRG